MTVTALGDLTIEPYATVVSNDLTLSSGGNIAGMASANHDITAVAAPDINASFTAGNNLTLRAGGSITGASTVGAQTGAGNLDLAAYGDAGGAFTVNGDVTAFKARGAITAALTATGAISNVYTYNTFAGNFSADTIANITAWGDIAGALTATTSIG